MTIDPRIGHLEEDLELIANGNGAGEAASEAPAAPLPPFPADALPSPIADWAKATATATQTPVDLSAGMALSALSTAALTAATVRCAPGWEEELAFWAVCVLPSGERKSAVLRAALEPVRGVEQDRLEAARPTVARQRAEREGLEARRKALTRKVGEGKADPAELGDVDERLDELGEPVLPRLLADDAAPEALAGLLARHGSMGILAAESALLDNLAGRYAEGRANIHLACQSLLRRADPHRPSRARRRTPRAPAARARAMRTAARPAPDHLGRDHARAGLPRPRRLPTASKQSRHARNRPPPVSAEVTSRYRDCLRRVATLGHADTTDTTGPSGASVGSVSGSESPTLTFSRDATEAFRDWRGAHEARLAPATGDLARVAAWAGRHPGRVARLAGLLHLAESRPEQPIAADTFHAAAAIAEYFTRHALAALVEDPLRAVANRACAWLRNRQEPTVSVRELHRGPVSDGTAAEARQVAERLERDGRLRRRQDPAPDPAGGRPPSPTYDVLQHFEAGP